MSVLDLFRFGDGLVLPGTWVKSASATTWRLGNDEWHAWIGRWMKQIAESQSLSVSQAAKDLSITNDVAYALIRNGLLNSAVECRNGVTSHRVDSNAIVKFKQTYTSGKELSKILHLTSKKAAAHMRTLGIVPVAGPSSSHLKCRQYIWPKATCLEMIKRST